MRVIGVLQSTSFAATNHWLSILQHSARSHHLKEGWGKAVKFQSRQIHLGLSQWKMKEHLCCKKSGSLYSTPNSCHHHRSQTSSSFPFSGPLDISLRATISIKFVVVLMCRASSAGCTLQTCITINSILYKHNCMLEKKQFLVLICIQTCLVSLFCYNLRQVKLTSTHNSTHNKIYVFKR